jgi:hypothetical protein
VQFHFWSGGDADPLGNDAPDWYRLLSPSGDGVLEVSCPGACGTYDHASRDTRRHHLQRRGEALSLEAPNTGRNNDNIAGGDCGARETLAPGRSIDDDNRVVVLA